MNTHQEIECIHLMNSELFEGEPPSNISLLSKHLFDVCCAAATQSEQNAKLLIGTK